MKRKHKNDVEEENNVNKRTKTELNEEKEFTLEIERWYVYLVLLNITIFPPFKSINNKIFNLQIDNSNS